VCQSAQMLPRRSFHRFVVLASVRIARTCISAISVVSFTFITIAGGYLDDDLTMVFGDYTDQSLHLEGWHNS